MTGGVSAFIEQHPFGDRPPKFSMRRFDLNGSRSKPAAVINETKLFVFDADDFVTALALRRVHLDRIARDLADKRARQR